MTGSTDLPAPRRPRFGFFWRLMAAFAILLLTVAVLVALLTRSTAHEEFALFTNAAGRQQAALLAPRLADFYERARSWEGVEELLQLSSPGQGNRRGMGQGMRGGAMRSGIMGLRILLVGADGRVIADSQALRTTTSPASGSQPPSCRAPKRLSSMGSRSAASLWPPARAASTLPPTAFSTP